MSTLPSMHAVTERDLIMSKAKDELVEAISRVLSNHRLSDAESLSVLTKAFSVTVLGLSDHPSTQRRLPKVEVRATAAPPPPPRRSLAPPPKPWRPSTLLSLPPPPPPPTTRSADSLPSPRVELETDGELHFDDFSDFDLAEQLDSELEPFCACGRVVSQCDKSRAACNQANSEDGRNPCRRGAFERRPRCDHR